MKPIIIGQTVKGILDLSADKLPSHYVDEQKIPKNLETPKKLGNKQKQSLE